MAMPAIIRSGVKKASAPLRMAAMIISNIANTMPAPMPPMIPCLTQPSIRGWLCAMTLLMEVLLLGVR